jgi:hypothetical protein
MRKHLGIGDDLDITRKIASGAEVCHMQAMCHQ